MHATFQLPDFGRIAHDLQAMHDIASVASKIYIDHFEEAFDKEGWTDRALEPWSTRAMPEPAPKRNLLVKSGALRRSLHRAVSGGEFTISSALPYARIHNEGGFMIVTRKMRKYFWAMYYLETKRKKHIRAARWKGLALTKKMIWIPKRQFMGESATADAKVAARVEKMVKDVLDAAPPTP